MKELESVPQIRVGIVRSRSVMVTFNGTYCDTQGLGISLSGSNEFKLIEGLRGWHVVCGKQQFDDVVLMPEKADGTFTISDVEIGIGFHWDKHENQTFAGGLGFAIENEQLWAVNHIDVESYLRCVIASEMSATSDLELLKAHAVTSRSWLMAQVWGKGKFRGTESRETEGRKIVWRDREDHALFDVCADDHCQRYQGLGRVSNAKVDKAIAATRGMVLTYDGEVCDARFSKCCGGRTEVFETCWGNEGHAYLTSFHDAMMPDRDYPTDIVTERDAEDWIMGSPEAFCNTADAQALSQVLNDYDQTTRDFYRWSVTMTGEELGQLILEKGGEDIGEVRELTPLHRGPSGRIDLLRIVGSKGTLEIGKELEIRRLLSKTHLYSSAFVVSTSPSGRRFTLHGAGWGHGVGLCQIGAAVMAQRGFSFRGILYHYYRKALLERVWE